MKTKVVVHFLPLDYIPNAVEINQSLIELKINIKLEIDKTSLFKTHLFGSIVPYSKQSRRYTDENRQVAEAYRI